MSNIDSSRLISDLQRLAKQAQSMSTTQPNQNEQMVNGTDTFQELLKTAISNVNEAQKHAGDLKKSFDLGDPTVDLPEVMVASQKASIAFSALVETRNKLLEAYRDVMSMPV